MPVNEYVPVVCASAGAFTVVYLAAALLGRVVSFFLSFVDD